MRVIFLGTPDFARVILERLYNSENEIAGVVTQPDKERDRGMKKQPCPVKIFAEKHDLPVFQFQNINDEGGVLSDLRADIMITAAYGQILKQNILDMCPMGIVNVHASLLPAYRGPSPVQWALINGEKEVGVTIMRTELSVDAGGILTSGKISLEGDENSGEVLAKLAPVGAELLVKGLKMLENGGEFTPQDESRATVCRMLKKEDGKMDFGLSAADIVNRVRGLTPRPGAYFDCKNGRLKVLSAKTAEFRGKGKPGEIVSADKRLIVACGDGFVEILRLKPENGKEMDAKSYLAGHSLTIGALV